MCRIEIVLRSIVYRRLSNILIPVVVLSSNEQSIAKIRRIGHSVFFVHQCLADDNVQFIGRSHRNTATVHFGQIVAIDRSIVEIGLLLARFANSTCRNPIDIADKHQKNRGVASLLAHRIVRLHPRLYVSSSCRRRIHIIHIQIKTLLCFPFKPRLQLLRKVLVCHNQHLDRSMEKVGIRIKNILVDKRRIR